MQVKIPFWPHRFLAVASMAGVLVWALACGGTPASASEPAIAPRPGSLRLVAYEITDPNFGGMRVATIQIPAGWHAQHEVRWDFGSANYPVKVHFRVDAPDGRSWVELFPYDAVYWMTPMFQPIAPGTRAFGAVYAPQLAIGPAMQQLLIQPARGRLPDLKIVSARPVSAQGLAAAFNEPQLRGEAMTMRTRYTLRGMPVEEDFYAFYTATQTIPYTGPQGTSYEYHRILGLAHSVGAQQGLLPQVYPLLGHIVSTLRFDETFQAHRQRVSQYITQQYNAYLQRGYNSIAAAGQLSRSISANNDALLSSMQQQRAAQSRADAARRTSAGSGGNDGFSQYIRGTQRMQDPYWGESAQSSNYSHHWTDGQGNYRASNDASFNPNVGAGGGANWQRMEPAR